MYRLFKRRKVKKLKEKYPKIRAFKTALLTVFFVTEKLFILILRANMCLFLRYYLDYTEATSIFYFHLFEMITFFTAFVSGQVALFSFKFIFYSAPITYFLALLMTILTIVFKNSHESVAEIFLILTLVSLGLTHGFNLVSNLKVVEFELSDVMIRTMVCSSIVTNFIINISFPLIYYNVETITAYYFIVAIQFTLIVLLIVMQILIVIFYANEDLKFVDYGPLDHYSSVIYRIIFPIVRFCRAINEKRKKRKRKKKAHKEGHERETKKEPHWLDEVIPTFPETFINDMNFRMNYWKIFMVLPGIMLIFELKYSYWIFSVNRTNRYVGKIEVPTQVVFSMQECFMIITIVLHTFYFGPMYRKWWYSTPLKRLNLGSVFIVSVLMFSCALVYRQEKLLIRPNEPYPGQAKISVRNGLRSDVFINDKAVTCVQQYSLRHNEPCPTLVHSKSHLVIPDNNTEFLTKLEKNDHLYETMPKKFNSSKDLMPANIFPRTFYLATFFINLNHLTDGSQTLVIVPERSQIGDAHSIALLENWLEKNESNLMTLFVVEPYKISYYSVPFTRPRSTKPGVRFFFANETPIKNFTVERNSRQIYSFLNLEKLNPRFYLFEDGDGPNLNFTVDGHSISMDLKLEYGGLYDVVFLSEQGKINSFRIHTAESPHTISFWIVIPQYLYLTIGEYYLGVLCLRFLFSQTPKKLHFHTLCDWHLMHALSNVIIIVILKCRLVLTFFWQMAIISIVNGVSLFALLVFSLQYEYRYPKDMKLEEKYNNLEM